MVTFYFERVFFHLKYGWMDDLHTPEPPNVEPRPRPYDVRVCLTLFFVLSLSDSRDETRTK